MRLDGFLSYFPEYFSSGGYTGTDMPEKYSSKLRRKFNNPPKRKWVYERESESVVGRQ